MLFPGPHESVIAGLSKKHDSFSVGTINVCFPDKEFHGTLVLKSLYTMTTLNSAFLFMSNCYSKVMSGRSSHRLLFVLGQELLKWLCLDSTLSCSTKSPPPPHHPYRPHTHLTIPFLEKIAFLAKALTENHSLVKFWWLHATAYKNRQRPISTKLDFYSVMKWETVSPRQTEV